MRNLLDRLLNSVRNILSFADPRYKQHFDWDPTQGGGGGGSYSAGDGIDITSNTIKAKIDNNTIQFNTSGQMVASVEGGVTKEYVDAADQNLQDQIDERVEKDTGTGQWVYTSEDGTTVMKNVATTIDTSTASIPNSKAVKDYVDGELEDKADKATTLSGYGITDAYTKTETNTELDKKLDKRTTGVEVYSHSDATQGAMTVKTTMSSSPTDTNMLTEKAVKTELDKKQDKVEKSTSSTSVSYAGTNWGNMNWTCIKTKVNASNYHYHWFGYMKKTNYTFSNWSNWGSLFLSGKIAINLPNSNMVGKCVFMADIDGATAFLSESYNSAESRLDLYFIRGTQIGSTSTSIEVKVMCDYIGS